MKQPYATMSKSTPEPVMDLYQDEIQAMVYVGDVYSLVAQQGVVGAEPRIDDVPLEQPGDSIDDNDSLLPFIR